MSVIAGVRALWRIQGLDITTTGTEHLPATGGVVMAINHTGYLDFLPAALGVHSRGRRVRFMIKAEMQKIAIMRFLIKHTRTVPVDRSAGAHAYLLAVDTLRSGEVVGVYPEATISRSFEIKDFKTGAARMALDAEVPIAPVIVWGAQRIATKGQPRHLGRTKTPIIVRFGDPIRPHAGADDDAVELTKRLRTTMQQLLLGVQQQYVRAPGGCVLGAVPSRWWRSDTGRGRRPRRGRCGRQASQTARWVNVATRVRRAADADSQ